jgi:glycosyltransferase involved in cell wall biosynthesis
MAFSKIEILFFTGADPNRSSPHQLMAALWLNKKGWRVRMFSAGARSFFGNTVTSLGSLSTVSFPIGPSVLIKLLWQLRLFIVIAKTRFFANSIFYFQGHVGAVAAFFALPGTNRSRVIYHTQDYLEPGRHPFWAFFEKRLARRAGHVICNEINRARFMMSNYQLKNFPLVVRTALPREWPVPEYDAPVRAEIFNRAGIVETSTTRLVLHLGPFSNVRCSRFVTKAISLLTDEYVLVFTGMDRDSYRFREAEEAVKAEGIEKQVAYLGDLPFNELLRYVACCDIGLLLYPDDGVGNFYQAPGRLTEYLRCGLPIVTSNFPGLELITLKFGLGIACDPESPQDIALAIQTISNRSLDERQVERMRLKGLAMTEFSYEKQAGQLEEILKKIQSEL